MAHSHFRAYDKEMEQHPYHRDAKIFLLLVSAFIIGTIAIFLGIVLYGERQIQSYADCARSRTSKILESYPEICMSAGGKRFVNPDADRIVLPTEPQDEVKAPFSFSLPDGWSQTDPDPAVTATDPGVTTLEFIPAINVRPYPNGVVTVQYTQEAGRLEPPQSVFELKRQTISGIDYRIVTGEENHYQYEVYHGASQDQKYSLRVFLRYQSEAELMEQRQILSTFQFGQ